MKGHVRKRASVRAFVDGHHAQRCLRPAVLPVGGAVRIVAIGWNVAYRAVGKAMS